MVKFYAFLLPLLLATSSALAFPLPEGRKKSIRHQRDLDQEVSETRRELFSDRDTYNDDGIELELEPRASRWDKVKQTFGRKDRQSGQVNPPSNGSGRNILSTLKKAFTLSRNNNNAPVSPVPSSSHANSHLSLHSLSHDVPSSHHGPVNNNAPVSPSPVPSSPHTDSHLSFASASSSLHSPRLRPSRDGYSISDSSHGISAIAFASVPGSSHSSLSHHDAPSQSSKSESGTGAGHAVPVSHMKKPLPLPQRFDLGFKEPHQLRPDLDWEHGQNMMRIDQAGQTRDSLTTTHQSSSSMLPPLAGHGSSLGSLNTEQSRLAHEDRWLTDWVPSSGEGLEANSVMSRPSGQSVTHSSALGSGTDSSHSIHTGSSHVDSLFTSE